MALRKTIQTKFDLAVPDAYCRVENVLIRTKSSLEFLLKTYSKPNSLAEISSELFCCDYSLSGPNPVKQAYEYLKTLPEFESAEDC